MATYGGRGLNDLAKKFARRSHCLKNDQKESCRERERDGVKQSFGENSGSQAFRPSRQGSEREEGPHGDFRSSHQ